ncbi:MAG: hypothetical protein B7Z26_05765, partial [Asticcacaulis sp. 32-58-5]
MSDLNRRHLLQSAAVTGAALSSLTAGAALAAPKAKATDMTDYFPQDDLAPRERTLLDFDWKFHFGHASDMAKDFDYGIALRTHAKQGARGA